MVNFCGDPLDPDVLSVVERIVNINVANSPNLKDGPMPFSLRWKRFEQYLLNNGVPKWAFERILTEKH